MWSWTTTPPFTGLSWPCIREITGKLRTLVGGCIKKSRYLFIFCIGIYLYLNLYSIFSLPSPIHYCYLFFVFPYSYCLFPSSSFLPVFLIFISVILQTCYVAYPRDKGTTVRWDVHLCLSFRVTKNFYFLHMYRTEMSNTLLVRYTVLR